MTFSDVIASLVGPLWREDLAIASQPRVKKTSRVPFRVTWAVEQLSVRADDRLLEIGCGSGYAIRLVCEQLADGTITGIDRSATQVARARVKNKSCIDSGRACVEHLTLEQAPELIGRRQFSKVFAINVNAFWTTPAPSFESIVRLLRHDGCFYLFYESPSAGARRGIAALMQELLPRYGFSVEMRSAPDTGGRTVCFVGRPS